MGIEHRTHSLVSRGKLPQISLRVSAISSSMTWKPRSAHSPRRLRRGFFALFFVFKKSAKSRTSLFCSGGKSRSFSRSCSSRGHGCSKRSRLSIIPPSKGSPATVIQHVCKALAASLLLRLRIPHRRLPSHLLQLLCFVKEPDGRDCVLDAGVIAVPE